MTPVTTTEADASAAAEWRAHWRVVAGAGLGVATGYGLFPFVASQFVQPLEATFGWPRAAQALTQTAAIGGAFLAPAVGRAVDAVGVRPIALVGMPLLAIVYGLLATMHGSIAVFYGLMGAAILTGLGTTGIVYIRAVTTCFYVSLGRALAVTRSGVALTAAVVPILIFDAIHRFGWRAGYALLAAITLAGLLPCWLWVREPSKVPRGAATERRSWSRLLLNSRIVLLCLSVALTMGPVVGLLSQLQPLLTGKGIEPATAAMFGGLLALSVLAGTLLTGLLMDRIWAPLIGCVFSIVPAIGCLLLLSPSVSHGTAAAAVIGIGLAQGAELDLAGYMIARYFGIADFAAIFGLSILGIGISSALSSVAYARIFDQFGSYNHALQASTVLFGAASAAYLCMGKYPRPFQDLAREH